MWLLVVVAADVLLWGYDMTIALAALGGALVTVLIGFLVFRQAAHELVDHAATRWCGLPPKDESKAQPVPRGPDAP